MTLLGVIALAGWIVSLIGWGVTLRLNRRLRARLRVFRDAATFWRGLVLLIVTRDR